MNPACIKTILSKLIGVISKIGLFYLERHISNMKEGEKDSRIRVPVCLCVCGTYKLSCLCNNIEHDCHYEDILSHLDN